MASSNIKIPSAQVFQTDPIESVYAHMLPQLGGLAYLFQSAAADRRISGQQDYSAGVDRANEMTARLTKMEEDAKLRVEGMKAGTSLATHGYLPSTLMAGGDLFNDPNAGDTVANIMNDERVAHAQHLRASGAGGGAGGKDEVVQTDFPGVNEGPIQYKYKGTGSTERAQAAKLARDKENEANGGKRTNARPLTPEQKQIWQQMQERGN